jgi:hypothetical protein
VVQTTICAQTAVRRALSVHLPGARVPDALSWISDCERLRLALKFLPQFLRHDLRLLNPRFDSPLLDVLTDLEHLRRLEVRGSTPQLAIQTADSARLACGCAVGFGARDPPYSLRLPGAVSPRARGAGTAEIHLDLAPAHF